MAFSDRLRRAETSPEAHTRSALLAGHLAFALVLASAFLPFELIRHGRLVETLAPLSGEAALGAAIVGSHLEAMLPVTLGFVLLLAGGATRAAAVVGGTGVTAVMIWGGVDLLAQHATGNRAAYYLEFVTQPDALHWAGGFSGIGALAGGGGLALAASASAALVVGAGARRAVQRRGGLFIAVALGALWIGLVSVGLGPGRAASAYRAELGGAGVLAHWLQPAEPPGAVPKGSAEERAARLYAEYFPLLQAPPAAIPAALPVARPAPDIVVIVADSLRADLVTPAIMPRLCQWRRQGTQFRLHHAGSNRSDWGIFSLIYGLTPLRYSDLVRAGAPPTLPATLRAAGYSTHLHTSFGRGKWLLVKLFMDRPHFDEVQRAMLGPEDWQRDQRMVAKARALLDRAAGHRLVVLWLMSTHFPYSYPPAYESAKVPDEATGVAPEYVEQWRSHWVRYVRSARFLDDLLGEWLERIDLARTIVVVTADHGESLFDDGTFGHGSRLSLPQVRVPLLVAGPGVPRGRVFDQPTSHVDVAPSLFALAGLDAAAWERLPGQPLLTPGAPAPAYAAVYQPLPLRLDGLSEWTMSQQRDSIRQLLLTSGDLRVAVRLDPTAPRTSHFTRLADDGRSSPEPLTPLEADTALAWLADHLARAARPAQH